MKCGIDPETRRWLDTHPLWQPEVGQRVVVQTKAMEGRDQHARVLRYEYKEPFRVVCRWIRSDGQRGRTQSYLTRGLRPVDVITQLGELSRD
jgi:hypothetical protein